MLIKSFASVSVLAVLLTTTGAMAESHEKEIMANGILPNAKPGECYAKVIIPAQYEVTSEQVLVKPVSEKVSVTDVVFDEAEKYVIEKEGFTDIKAVPAKFREEIEEVEISKAIQTWMTDLGKKGIPASPALLAGAKTNGVSLTGAAVGACYKEYYNPATYEETTKEVLVKDESEEIKIAPAQFEETEETVVVKQASQKKVYRAAEYETIEQSVEVEPAKTVWKKSNNLTSEVISLVEVPAVFKTVAKTVLKSESAIDSVEVPEETTAIKVQKLVSDTTIDKVKIPAEYKTVKLRNKVSDASFTWTAGSVDTGTYTGNQICLTEVPAKFEKITKLVLESEATISEEKIPPVAKLMKVKNVATEAKEVRELVQAEYKAVEKRVKISDEITEWRRILCETDVGPDVNRKIQQALLSRDLYKGPVDGAIGSGTLAAIAKFQKDNGLATGAGALTIETLEKLGVL